MLFFVSTAWIPPVTSHLPEVRNRGIDELAGLNSAMWLNPSGVGTISRYASAEFERGYTFCDYKQFNSTVNH